MLRKFIKSALDKWTKNEDEQSSAPPPPQADLKAASQKPVETQARDASPPATPAVPRKRRRRKRPASGNRPAALPSPVDRPTPATKTRWSLAEFKVAPLEGETRFHDLDLPSEVMHGIFDLGFEYCTPIQAAIMPKTLAGTDASGKAQTGTGKTAAFLITILTHLKRKSIEGERRTGTPRALIMVPTRELAMQVKKEANLLGKYCRCEVAAIFGGMDYQKQKQMLADRVIDIVVATPGRLLDFNRQGDVDLGSVEILVIDEADEMLDMGFIPDIRRIVQSTPPKSKRQTMFFGATLTPEVARLAPQWTRDPVTVEIDPEQVAVDSVDQVLYLVTARERFTVLYNMITQQNLKRVIVFCNRRDEARRLEERLRAHGLNSAVLSGEVAQRKRIKTVEDFREGRIRVMVSTDVAGRGIHIEGISHVVNYNLPLDVEDYVHRIGRTGRAGATGNSIGFATEYESYLIPAIEEFLGKKLSCVYPDDALLTPVPPPTAVRPSPAATKAPATGAPSQSRAQAPRRRRRSSKGNTDGAAGGTEQTRPPDAAPPGNSSQ
ncbi:MAG: DEAD/DEAH box helicase [Chloroflexota bacterium]|nr:DEAD/DEAH box helicase [Chloroflexota bacterium]